MNPGVEANIIAIVLCILVITGWGAKVLQDGEMSVRTAVLFLISFVFLSNWTWTLPAGVQINPGGVLIPLAASLWLLVVCRNLGVRLQWAVGAVTVASTMVVLMTLVPLDPAFFLVDAEVLFPASAVILSVCSMRRPFFALTVAISGLLLAASLDPLLNRGLKWSELVFGGGEVRDLVAYTALGVLIAHGPYHAAVRIMKRTLKGIFRPQRQEGGPEHA
jgi:hypothetical protein